MAGVAPVVDSVAAPAPAPSAAQSSSAEPAVASETLNNGDEKKKDDGSKIPDGAGPAVAEPAPVASIPPPKHVAPPKPVEVMSVPQTPVNSSTPAGGTPRPELKIDEEPKPAPPPQDSASNPILGLQEQKTALQATSDPKEPKETSKEETTEMPAPVSAPEAPVAPATIPEASAAAEADTATSSAPTANSATTIAPPTATNGTTKDVEMTGTTETDKTASAAPSAPAESAPTAEAVVPVAPAAPTAEKRKHEEIDALESNGTATSSDDPPTTQESKPDDTARPEKKVKLTDKIKNKVAGAVGKIEEKVHANGSSSKGKVGRPKKEKKSAPVVGMTARKTRSQGPV